MKYTSRRENLQNIKMLSQKKTSFKYQKYQKLEKRKKGKAKALKNGKLKKTFLCKLGLKETIKK